MKRFLFPFSTEKYKFLEKKWWHRMIIFLFFILTIPIVIISYLIISEINIHQNIDYNNVANELMADMKIGVEKGIIEVDPAKVKKLYPELGHLEDDVIIDLTADLMNGIKQGKQLDEMKLKKLYPEFFPSQKTSKIKNILENIIYSLITLYLLIIILQLIYYKGIIYIIYGNKK